MAKTLDPPVPAETQEEVDERGRLTLALDGVEYRLRPSHEAIKAIERATGRTTYDLCVAASRVTMPLETMAVVVSELMLAEGKALPEDAENRADYLGAKLGRVEELIYEAGIPKTAARIYVVLMGAVSGGYTAKGEAKAATAASETK